MKKTSDRPGNSFLRLLALALILALVPFSCLGEAASAPEATLEQIYADALWSDGFDYGSMRLFPVCEILLPVS